MNEQKVSINKELYCQFLIGSQSRFSAVGLAELFDNHPAHDSFTRWLKTVKLKPIILWEYAQGLVNMKASVSYLIIDDTVLDKWYPHKIEPVYKQYSGNHHRIVNGIGVVNLLWNEHQKSPLAEHIPVDLRIYDIQRDGKTKNQHCQNMLASAYDRGFINITVLMDSAYSDLETLKQIRDYHWFFIAGIKSNRKVSLAPHKLKSVVDVAQTNKAIECHLRGFGFVKVIKIVRDHDIRYLATNNLSLSYSAIREASDRRWKIEEYHRGEKQAIGIESCQFRNQRAQRNHILCSSLAFLAIEKHRLEYGTSWYESKQRIIADALKEYLKKPFIPFPKNATNTNNVINALTH